MKRATNLLLASVALLASCSHPKTPAQKLGAHWEKITGPRPYRLMENYKLPDGTFLGSVRDTAEGSLEYYQFPDGKVHHGGNGDGSFHAATRYGVCGTELGFDTEAEAKECVEKFPFKLAKQ